MEVFNLKAIGIGVSLFLVSYLIFSYFVSFDTEAALGATGLLLLPIFIVPGFVAAAVARRHGVLNGAAVGVVMGFIALAAFLLPFEGGASGAFGAATIFGSSVILFSSFGGLLWHVYLALFRLLQRGP